MSRPKLLLHICCAPCASHVLNVLSEAFDVTGYFYNPNIHPEEEFERRLMEVRRLKEHLDFPLKIGPYDEESWMRATRGLEEEPEGGRRCEVCLRIRLLKTVSEAHHEGLGVIATTLTVGPRKRADMVNHAGNKAAKKYSLEFHAADFKKKDGFKKSVAFSKKHNLYRQNYCGCIYSLREHERFST